MADLPEKIWAVEGLCEILSFNTYDNGGPSYTRTDVALAMVAAERDDLVKAHRQGYAQGGAAGKTLRKAMVDRIEELEAKLAKAVGALDVIAGRNDYADDPWGIARAILAELKEGEKT